MKRLLLIDPDDGSRGAIAARLRGEGHEVLETDEQNALLMYREGLDAVFVWNAGNAARAAALLDELQRDGRPPVLFFAPSLSDAASCTPSPPWAELVGESTAMRDLRATVRRLARRPNTHGLVGGEPGTGKQAFARVLHRSTAVGGEFVLAPPERVASLLDGGPAQLVREGGTLYVPNVCAVPKAEQRRLAAWLAAQDGSQGGPVRFVAGATLGSEELPFECVRRDVLHPELSTRLPVTLELVPLRKRTGDVPLLVRHFLRAWSMASHLAEPTITPEALDRLSAHAWSGNLRELANVLECAAATGGGNIDASSLPALGRRDSGFDYELPREGIDFSEFERAVLAQALRRAGGNQTRAASLLGLTRDQIRYRMGKFGLAREPVTSLRAAGDNQPS
jgi:DNA-binding NtrC family response regulator